MSNIDEPIARRRGELLIDAATLGTAANMFKEEALRRSALEAGTCLFRYNQIYNLGVDDGSDVSLRGILFHAAAELYIRMLYAAGVTADIEIAREAFIIAAERCVAPGRTVIVAEILFFRWAERFELKIDHLLLVEETHKTLRHGRRFAWRPDLVYANERGIIIYDWKTHFVAWSPEQARKEFQARYYLLMARIHYPNQPRYEFRFVFVRLNITVSVVFTVDEFDEAERQVDAALAAVVEADRSKTYPATGGPHCQYCRLECPINGRGGLLPTRIDDGAQFDALASEWLALRQRTSQLRKLIKGYVVAEGPREANGMMFDHSEIIRSRYKVDDVQAIANERGVDVSFLTVSRQALGPMTNERKFPSLAPALNAVRLDQRSWKFDPKKTGSFIIQDGLRLEGEEDGEE